MKHLIMQSSPVIPLTPSYVQILSSAPCPQTPSIYSVKSSWAIIHVKCLYETNISRTISVPIIRDLICQQNPQCLIYLPPQATCCCTGQPLEASGQSHVPTSTCPSLPIGTSPLVAAQYNSKWAGEVSV